MSRNGWFGVLAVSVLLFVVAGVSLVGATGDDDIGSLDVSAATASVEQTEAEPGDVPDEGSAREESEARAGAAPTVPAIARRPASLETVQAEAAAQAVPVGLRVPSVDLDAPLDQVGVRDDGLMEIPDDGDRAGWYRYGPTPGDDEGSAVLAGHVDTQEGLGAMAALMDVGMDAEVEVEMDDGTVHRYRVVGRQTIEKDELPVTELFDRSGPARLTLVTCGGPWRYEASSYRDNVVVVAVPIDER
ncbi:class F sortase [Ornithinimicrobium sediminis]|uniref:class F sortase n=1 Tax=Ornithinimicrobium sediminis TaxID=2904603 RepID=UPI001E4BDDB4|nr:class F sortase [Ornithinimicrobium sediminis]MCE0488398.1 class F sortase [Ornithinimicrobium sediminis]